MAETEHVQEPKNFAPKDPPKLNPPKDDPISLGDLAKCDGTDSSYPTYVAIMGTVFDVSGNTAYSPKNPYNGMDMPFRFEPYNDLCVLKPHQLIQVSVFAGKDASRALAQSSLKAEDCTSEWEDLPEKEKSVLKDWFTFFSKRYNIVGKVQL